MVQYHIILEYRVDKKWFNDPSNVFDSNIQSLKINKIISEYEVKQKEYTESEFVSKVRVVSNLNKEDMVTYLDENSTRLENWKII